jgi:hypothetical protein
VARTNAFQLWIFLDHLCLVEERNEGLVRGLHEHQLQWIVVERDALEGAEDRVQESAAGNYVVDESQCIPKI